MSMDIMNISNERIGELVKNNPNMMMYLELTTQVKGLSDEIEKIKAEQMIYNSKINTYDNKIENIERTQQDINTELNEVKDVTYVLATDDGKRKELTKLVNRLCYTKYTDNKNTIKDKLFHRSLIKACYDRLYNQFEVNSYTRIKIDDFNEALKVVNRWFNNEQNIKKVVSKRLQEYINDEFLPENKKLLVDKFLEMTNGGKNLW